MALTDSFLWGEKTIQGWLNMLTEAQLLRVMYLAGCEIIRRFPEGPRAAQARDLGDAFALAALKRPKIDA